MTSLYLEQRQRRVSEVETTYLRWLADHRNWSLAEARVYAAHGHAELIKYQRNGPPTPMHCTKCQYAHERGKASPHPPQ